MGFSVTPLVELWVGLQRDATRGSTCPRAARRARRVAGLGGGLEAEFSWGGARGAPQSGPWAL